MDLKLKKEKPKGGNISAMLELQSREPTHYGGWMSKCLSDIQSMPNSYRLGTYGNFGHLIII